MAFAALLERTPPHLRHVRYLFVSSHDPEVEGIDEAMARYSLLSDKIEKLPKGDGSDEEAEEEAEAYEEAEAEEGAAEETPTEPDTSGLVTPVEG